MKTIYQISLAALAMFAFAVPPLAAQEPDAELEAVKKWANETVERLTLSNETQSQELRRKPGSLIRWTNPIIGKIYGDSYLWTDQGVPAAFLSIYARFDSGRENKRLTFQSLSGDAISARLDDEVVWNPREPGVTYSQIAKPPPVPPRLVSQRSMLRRIAQRYKARIAESTDEDRFRDLRLLTQPLFQYESEQANVVAGALFAFVDGTDPELLLMVELHDDSEPAWRMAPVRQNHRRLQLLNGTETIWDAPPLAPPFPNPKISDPSGVYFNTAWARVSGES